MLTDSNYNKILNYFDRQFWSGKTDETNWNYYGLILDWYFDNSVFSIDYLNIEDYFDVNGASLFLKQNFSLTNIQIFKVWND